MGTCRRYIYLVLLAFSFTSYGQHIIGVNASSIDVGGFGSEYQAVYDAMTNKPSEGVDTAQNTMVASIVTAGTWAKLDYFVLLAQESNADSEALINWILPGTRDATLISDPAFVSLEGFTGEAAKAINTNWNPTDDGSNFVLNSASIGVYVRTNTEGGFDAGSRTGSTTTSMILAARFGGDFAYTRINSSALTGETNADSRGFWVANRTASNVSDIYRNGSLFKHETDASEAISTFDFYILAVNLAGSIGSEVTRQISLFFVGSGLTTDDITALNNAIETYMDSNSKGVIP